MVAFRAICRILAVLISLYSLLCFVRIILTWIPSVSYSKFTQIVAKITDPYLNLFRGIRWLVIGSFDFSPALALCILGGAESLFTGFARGAALRVGYILSSLVMMVWGIANSLLVFIALLLAIRLILMLIKGNSYNSSPLISSLDRTLTPICFKIAKTFTFGKQITYKLGLIISLIAIILVCGLGSLVFSIISNLLFAIPF